MPSSVSAARDIGVTAAVRPDVHGTPPEQDSRILHVGADLVANEKIDTSRIGQTHLLFRDGSTLSIGPGASVVLDKFVYDPASKTGELVVSASKGVLRFVGGRISKKRPVLIKTPTAVIGVRGGVALMRITTPEQRRQDPELPPASVTMLFGDEVFMDSGNQRQTMSRPGFTMRQTPGGGITQPEPATQQQLGQQLAELEDLPPEPEDDDPEALGEISPAAGGGVTDDDVAQTQLSDLGSDNDPETVSNDPNTTPPDAAAATDDQADTSDPSQQLAMDALPGDSPSPSTSEPDLPSNRFPISAVIDIDIADNVVAENAISGSPVGVTAFASDDDIVDSVTYALADNVDGRFTIDPSTGIITVIGTLDYETATTHTLTVLATSSDSSVSELTVSIVLTDDNSEFQASAPTDSNPAGNAVSESASVGAVVGVTALSQDFDGTDTVTYSLVDSADGRFAIDPNTGVITVLNPGLLDVETTTTHSVIVLATSTDGSTNMSTIPIGLIDDVTEFDPTAIIDSNTAGEIALDTAANGATVGFTAFSTDGDLTDNITYSLLDDAGGRFAIDPTTGVVTIADASQIDYKTARTHQIRPQATSQSGVAFLTPPDTTINVGYDGFVGRFKRGSGPTGTTDTNVNENIALPDILLFGSTFSASVAQGDFDLEVPLAGGTATVGIGDTLPFVCCITVFNAASLTADQEFVFYEITELGGARDILFAGDPTAAFPTTGFTAYTLEADFPRNSELGLIAYSSATPSSRGLANIAWDDSGVGAQRAFGGGVVYINGQGTSQTSGAFVMTGKVRDDGSVDPHIGGRFFGSVELLQADGVAQFFGGPLSSSDAGDGTDFFGIAEPNYFVLESSDVDDSDAILSRGATHDISGIDSTYYPNVAAYRDNGAAFANSRTATTWEGFAAGLEVITDGGSVITGNDVLLTANNHPGNIVIARDPSKNTVAMDFLLDEVSGPRSLHYEFGNNTTDGSNAFIDDKRFYADAIFATVDGQTVDSQHGAATSDIVVFDNVLPAGVSLCDCQFTTWGVWSANRQLELSSAQRAHTHLGTWVAGSQSGIGQIVGIAPQTATYTGHVLAGVQNGGDYYHAAGKIDLVFKFTAGNYTFDDVTITDLDGTDYATPSSAVEFSNPLYDSQTAGLTITGNHPSAGPVTATLHGSFFGTGTPPEEAAGQIMLTGDEYLGAGTYVTKRP